MKTETLHKYGGIAFITGSLLLTLYSICFSLFLPVNSLNQNVVAVVLNPNWLWVTSVAFFGVIFMLFGFTAVYSKIRESSGTLGFRGYIIIELAYLFQACSKTWEICLWLLPIPLAYSGLSTMVKIDSGCSSQQTRHLQI